MRNIVSWLLSRQVDAFSPWRMIAWWEIRRLPFNVIVGIYGGLCLTIFFVSITSCGRLQPGEDAVEPLALIAAPFFINLLYTLGWLVELSLRCVFPDESPSFSLRLWMLGLGFTLFLFTVPAAIWSGIRLLQLVGVLT